MKRSGFAARNSRNSCRFLGLASETLGVVTGGSDPTAILPGNPMGGTLGQGENATIEIIIIG